MIEVICSAVFIGIISILTCSAFIQSINLKSNVEVYMEKRIAEKNLKMYMEKNVGNAVDEIIVGEAGLSIHKEGKVLKLFLKNGNLISKYIDDHGRKLYQSVLMTNVEDFSVCEKDHIIYVLMNIDEKEIVWGFLK